MNLQLTLPAASQAVRLSVRDAAATNKWLESAG